MPTTANITRPFTIVGNGRSGTSLISRVISAHPDCSFAGETVNLIHSVWKSLESSLPAGRHGEIPEVLRLQFLKLFPKPHTYWMHKPIGIPIVAHMFPAEEEFLGWFWDVLDAVFPDAKYFTVLRHPLDIISSSHRWWGRSHESIVESCRLVAKLITHPQSKVDLAVNYHDLVASPREEVERLFDYLELPFAEPCMKPFQKAHVISSETQSDPETENSAHFDTRRREGFTHKDAWDEFDSKLISEDFRTAVDDCWRKFEYGFGGWPRNVLAVDESVPDDASRITT